MSRGSRERVERQLERLARVLGRHLTTPARLEMLTLWGRHPNAWFSRRAAFSFILMPRRQIDEVLADLVEDGVLQRHQSGDLCLFALAEGGHVRRAVRELARLSPNERRYLLQRARLWRGDDSHELATEQVAPSMKPTLDSAT